MEQETEIRGLIRNLANESDNLDIFPLYNIRDPGTSTMKGRKNFLLYIIDNIDHLADDNANDINNNSIVGNIGNRERSTFARMLNDTGLLSVNTITDLHDTTRSKAKAIFDYLRINRDQIVPFTSSMTTITQIIRRLKNIVEEIIPPRTGMMEGGRRKSRGGCGCMVPQTGGYKMRGGYRATKKDKKYLNLYKKGKSIGFTMTASLKAKGLIPRANGTRRVSRKYR